MINKSNIEELIQTFPKPKSKIWLSLTHGHFVFIWSVNFVFNKSRFCFPKSKITSHLFLTNKVSFRSKHCLVAALRSIVENTDDTWKKKVQHVCKYRPVSWIIVCPKIYMQPNFMVFHKITQTCERKCIPWKGNFSKYIETL